MPISDLSAVTTTLINLITGVLKRDLSPSEPFPLISAIPPEREAGATGPSKAVSVHLLHVTESGEYRNRAPGPRTRDIQIQQIPLGLVLEYVVSVARSEETDEEVVLDLHRFLGLIARGLHDHPVVTPNTTFPGLPGTGKALAEALLDEDENISFVLKPATLQENLGFWATQDAKLARACLFVEARVAVLRPQAPTRAPGIVTSVGSYVFPSSGPTLSNSTSEIRFRLPNTTEVTAVAASPARVALLADVANPFAPADEAFEQNSVLRLEGTGFFPGRHFLVLKRDDLKLTIDLDVAAVVTNPSPPPASFTNDNWGFLVTPGAVTLSFRERVVAVVDDGSTAESVNLVPGIYSARLLLKDSRLPGGVRPRSSNLVAFTATPQIVDITAATGGTGGGSETYDLKISGSYLQPLSDPPSERKLELDLSVAGVALTEIEPPSTPPLVLNPGEFVIETANSDTIKFRLPIVTPVPLTPDPDEPAPVLLVVNGAFAPPRWLTSAGGAAP
jgi:hypothetical protein